MTNEVLSPLLSVKLPANYDFGDLMESSRKNLQTL